MTLFEAWNKYNYLAFKLHVPRIVLTTHTASYYIQPQAVKNIKFLEESISFVMTVNGEAQYINIANTQVTDIKEDTD